MSTVCYTYDLKCNDGNVSQVKINGTDVKRLKVNGNDVIHKFVTYKCTATINCSLRFTSLKTSALYWSCGADYTDITATGFFYVWYSVRGDSLSDSGGSIPNVEVYFRRVHILGTTYYTPDFNHATFSNLSPVSELRFGQFSDSITLQVSSEPFLVNVFHDEYSDGSELRTDWGNVNISEERTTQCYSETNRAFNIKLGSISKTFIRIVQEY